MGAVTISVSNLYFGKAVVVAMAVDVDKFLTDVLTNKIFVNLHTLSWLSISRDLPSTLSADCMIWTHHTMLIMTGRTSIPD